MARHGQSIVLASILALLSYVPFEIVAKFSLLFCGVVFVFDPLPPFSRLISLIGVVVVGVLSRIERNWKKGQVDFESELDSDLATSIQEEEEVKDSTTIQTVTDKKED